MVLPVEGIGLDVVEAPKPEVIGNLDGKKCWHHNVTNDNDHKLSRKVVGAVRRVVPATNFAAIDDLQKVSEHMALTAN